MVSPLLRRILLGLGLILAVLVTTVVACWWLIPDEPLKPEVQRFAEQPPGEQTGFFLLWGFAASPELDPRATGQRIVTAHDRVIAAQRSLKRFRVDDYLGEHPLRLDNDSKRLCDAGTENCLEVYQGQRAAVERALVARKFYLERYLHLHDHKDYTAAMARISWDTPLPSFAPILRISDLVDARIALQMESPATRAVALRALAAEVQWWKQVLRTSDILIAQIIASLGLHRKYRLASEIMNAYPETVRLYPELVEAITVPVPVSSTNIASALKAEARNSMRFFWDAAQHGRWPYGPTEFDWQLTEMLQNLLVRWSLRPNASINASYATFRDSVALYGRSPKELLAAHGQFLQQLQQRHVLSPDALFYNFAGRLALQRSHVDYSNYSYRLHDLVGLSRLLELQRRIIAAGLAPDQVAAALPGFGPALMDPYTETPMRWDPARRELSFTLHGKRFANFGVMQVAPVASGAAR